MQQELHSVGGVLGAVDPSGNKAKLTQLCGKVESAVAQRRKSVVGLSCVVNSSIYAPSIRDECDLDRPVASPLLPTDGQGLGKQSVA